MLGILSDVHANLPALQAVVADARMRGCARFISLGDVVGYGAQPGECIDLLRALGVANVMGNHDRCIVDNECCSRSSIVSRILDYQRTVLSPEHIEWLRASHSCFRENDMLFLHGGPEDYLDQYLYEVSQSTIPDNVRVLFSGHTHVQFVAQFGSIFFCNPGSVGQPRDGDSRAAYAAYDGSRVHLFRVEYDIDQAAVAMKHAGFDSYYYNNLYTGTQIGGRVDKIKVV